MRLSFHNEDHDVEFVDKRLGDPHVEAHAAAHRAVLEKVYSATNELLKYAGLPRKEYEAFLSRRAWDQDGTGYCSLAQKRYNDYDLPEAAYYDDIFIKVRLESCVSAMKEGKPGREWRAKWNATYVHTPAPWSTAFEEVNGGEE